MNSHITHGHFLIAVVFAASRGYAPLSIIRQHIE
jgi:hypothetical protein